MISNSAIQNLIEMQDQSILAYIKSIRRELDELEYAIGKGQQHMGAKTMCALDMAHLTVLASQRDLLILYKD